MFATRSTTVEITRTKPGLTVELWNATRISSSARLVATVFQTTRNVSMVRLTVLTSLMKKIAVSLKAFKTRRPRTSGIFSAPNLFEKDYWTTNLFLVDSFQHSNLRSLSKIWQKLHKKLWKLESFGFFVIFGFNLIYFSFRKQLLSLRKSILDNEFLPFLSR